MGKIILLIAVILVLASSIYILKSKPHDNSSGKLSSQQDSQQKAIAPTDATVAVDYSASFAIFTNGTFRIFTDSKYHNLSPDVFMESANIVRVKKQGVTWGDFFNTLPMKLEKDCLTTGTGQVFCTNEQESLRFFLNGQEDKNALERKIKQEDKLLVTYGNLTNAQLQSQLQKIPSTQ